MGTTILIFAIHHAQNILHCFAVLFLIITLVGLTLIDGQTYTYYSNTLGWYAAKDACECFFGHLAVIDTEVKQTALINQT